MNSQSTARRNQRPFFGTTESDDMSTTGKLNFECYGYDEHNLLRKLSDPEIRGVLTENWGAPFQVIRELRELPNNVTESQARLFAIGSLADREWSESGYLFSPPDLPTDIDEAMILLETDAAQCSLRVTIQIDEQSWQFLFACAKS